MSEGSRRMMSVMTQLWRCKAPASFPPLPRRKCRDVRYKGNSQLESCTRKCEKRCNTRSPLSQGPNFKPITY